MLQGGNDVAPETYGEMPLHPEWAGDRVRDRYEIELIDAFVRAGKPVFGICRGLQLINVAHGGTLYQDIKTQKPGALTHRDAAAYDLNFHQVDILRDSRLGQLLPPGRHKINSVHHQGIKDVAPGFRVEAVSPVDGVVGWTRAVSAPTPTNGWPAVGVQVNVATTVTAVPTSLMVETIFNDFWEKNTLLVPFTGVQLVDGSGRVATSGRAFPFTTLMTAVWEMK